MAFLIHSTDDGRIQGVEYLPCSAIQPKIGMAMVMTGGLLAAATGTVKPTYISMCEKDGAVSEGEEIPVIRVHGDMTFETEFSEDASSLKLGDKVTLHASSGISVTATKTGGVAEIVYMDGTAIGDKCRVRFPSDGQ